MDEFKNRYRQSNGNNRDYKNSVAKGYSPNIDGRKYPSSSRKSERPMTYDDYIRQIKDVEKIIEIDDSSKWNQFRDFVSEYWNWVDEKKQKYYPKANRFVKKKLSRALIVIRSISETIVRSTHNKLKPLEKKIGQRNLKYSIFSVLLIITSSLVFTVLATRDSASDKTKEVSSSGDSSRSEVNGINTNSPAGVADEKLVRVESRELDFDILFRAGIDSTGFDIVKISPEGADPAYTYVDSITLPDGNEFEIQVTQQVLPKDFDLESVALSFNANSMFRVDDISVYHGVSSTVNGVQSLLFIKDGLFISIRSSNTFSDDVWAGYIVSLQ